MKYIHKNNEPIEFTQWKSENPGLLYNDLYGLYDLVKRTLKNSLISEQKHLCCYCECCIESSTSHIEHFKPKDSNGPYAHLQLHLDSSLLNEQRKNLIDFFLELGDEDMDEEIAIHLDETGAQLNEFYTMIEYLKDRF